MRMVRRKTFDSRTFETKKIRSAQIPVPSQIVVRALPFAGRNPVGRADWSIGCSAAKLMHRGFFFLTAYLFPLHASGHGRMSQERSKIELKRE